VLSLGTLWVNILLWRRMLTFSPSLVDVVFHRGIAMQRSVERNSKINPIMLSVLSIRATSRKPLAMPPCESKRIASVPGAVDLFDTVPGHPRWKRVVRQGSSAERLFVSNCFGQGQVNSMYLNVVTPPMLLRLRLYQPQLHLLLNVSTLVQYRFEYCRVSARVTQ